MIHYTPLTYEEIFEEEEKGSSQWVSVNYASIQVSQKEDLSGYEIVQLISTDPSDYLKKHLQPGSTFHL